MPEYDTKPVCKFYLNIYKRMVTWFGFSRPFWLCDMNQEELLKCILRMVITPNMYIIFITVAIRIRRNNDRDVSVLENYKKTAPDTNSRNAKRKQYYDDNAERIREYNKMYHMLKKAFLPEGSQRATSGINIFKKNN